MRRIALALVLALVVVAGLGALAVFGHFGETQGRGAFTETARDPAEVALRRERQALAREALGVATGKQILFGDLHVHTTYSLDAFSASLPMARGEGSHPPGDACDFARFCSGLDFFSFNDHAESLTPYQWQETKAAVRQCNAVAGNPANPDLVTFLGWEWTQIGDTAEEHYGHKNVVLLGTAEDEVPTRPIASRRMLFPGIDPFSPPVRLALIVAAPGDGGRQPYLDFARFLEDRNAVPPCPDSDDVRALPAACAEAAPTPTELFRRLDQWGFPRLVIPHGNTWGVYTPPRSSWDKQLRAHTDPDRDEFLIEVFSGHGNIESYRSWRALGVDAEGNPTCLEPSDDYLPTCWQAGEIIRERCRAAGEDDAECERRAVEARANFLAAGGAGITTVPGARAPEWLDAGQCRDCYLPAFNYRPAGSVQYALALRETPAEGPEKRFRFGMLGSSDVHSARPGNGYKEFARRTMSDANLGALSPSGFAAPEAPEPRSRPAPPAALTPEFERFTSFFGLGGLVAVHSAGRDRQAIWDALARREVYGTSGPRILLWFDLLPGTAGAGAPMGSAVRRGGSTPRFAVRALGAFEQKPGCPADVVGALPAERLARLCAGECYHPSDRRHAIDRIEVVRIRPRVDPTEDVADLIEDPWRVLPCPGDAAGCRVEFDDPGFARDGRDTVYYVRAHQVATPTVNAGNLRCETDETGRCVSVEPCSVVPGETPPDDDCLAPAEERAWSSPIFVDFAAPEAR
jgi:hypothetical protein